MSLKKYILDNNFDADGIRELGQSEFDASNLNRYSQIAQASYQDQRPETFDKFTFDSQLSTPEIAVFDSPNEISLGLRGTQSFSDSLTDAFVTLGDYSENGRLGKRVLEVQNKINTIKNNNIHKKKISVSGHSLGGSIAGQIGIDNPDLDIYTFNRGTGINPFPAIKNSIYNNLFGDGRLRSNIKNYRISGDVASVTSKFNPFQSDGETFTISPLKPTPEMKKTSDGIVSSIKKVTDLEPFGISKSIYNPEYYLAHSLGNFVNRTQKNIHEDPHIYSKKLAKTTGKLVSTVGMGIYNKYKTAVSQNLLEKEAVTDNRIEQMVSAETKIQNAEEVQFEAQLEFDRISDMAPSLGDTGGQSINDMYVAAEKALTKAKKKVKKLRVLDRAVSRNRFEDSIPALDDAKYKMVLPDFIDKGLETINNINPYAKALFGGNIASVATGIIYDSFNESPENEFLI